MARLENLDKYKLVFTLLNYKRILRNKNLNHRSDSKTYLKLVISCFNFRDRRNNDFNRRRDEDNRNRRNEDHRNNRRNEGTRRPDGDRDRLEKDRDRKDHHRKGGKKRGGTNLFFTSGWFCFS